MSIADSSVQPDLSPVLSAGGQAADASAPGLSPWELAVRRLKRNKAALIFGALFFVLVALALAAPLWAQVADTTPARNHLSDTIVVDGKPEQVVTFDGVPISPTWGKKFFLGADSNGRDVAVRLLYGARNSLFIGITAALITTFIAVALGMLAGYFRGWTDAFISRGLDIAWAFPPTLLGVALGVSFALGGLKVGPLEISGDSLWIPTLIIGAIGVVYLARPIRGQVLSLREKEFVEAARALGQRSRIILSRHILPNVGGELLVLGSLWTASAIRLEASLSFIGLGVPPPTPTWGQMIRDGTRYLADFPLLSLAPGAALLITVFAFNLVGDGLRDVLDPRSR